MALLVPPLVAGAIEIVDGGRIRMSGVEVANRIGTGLGHGAAPLRRHRRRLPPAAAFVVCEARRYFTPTPAPAAMAACCCRAFSSAWSMLKLAGRCRGGNSLNVLRNSPTIACAGTSRNARSAFHLS